MIILRLLGSSDDKEKEKIGVVRPDGGRGGAAPRGSQGSALKALRSGDFYIYIRRRGALWWEIY